MSKIFYVACILLVIYGSFSAYGYYVATTEEQLQLKKLNNEFMHYFSIQKQYLGKSIDSLNIDAYNEEKQQLQFKTIKTDYLLLIFSGNFECDPCLQSFNGLYDGLDKTKISFVFIAPQEEQDRIKQVKENLKIPFPMYYTLNRDWIKKNGLFFGPYAMLVDMKPRKIIHTFSRLSNTKNLNILNDFHLFLYSLLE